MVSQLAFSYPQYQREQAEKIAQLKEHWAPDVAQARSIISQLEALQQAYGGIIDDLAGRNFAGIPRSPANLNLLATIERVAHELQSLLHQPRHDLEAMITAVERLSPTTVALFRANADAYHQQLKFYGHTPAGIREAWQRLMHSVASLTQRLEAAGREKTFAPLPRLPQAPSEPRVETH